MTCSDNDFALKNRSIHWRICCFKWLFTWTSNTFIMYKWWIWSCSRKSYFEMLMFLLLIV